MTSQMDDNLVLQDLAALLDGELDAAGQARLQARLTAQPEAAPLAGLAGTQLAAMAMLKQRVGDAMRDPAPPMSADFKANLMARLDASLDARLANTPAEAPSPAPAPLPFPTQAGPGRAKGGPRSTGKAWQAALRRWSPAAVAAGFFVAASATVWQAQLQRAEMIAQAGHEQTFATAGDPAARAMGLAASTSATASLGDRPTIVTASMAAPVTYAQLSDEKVRSLGGRHRTCSREPDALQRCTEFPRQLDQMPKAIAGCIGKAPRKSLDLSHAGYEFSRAGECTLTGQRAVHLVYRAKTRGEDAVSLWVAPYDGRPQIRQGVIYQGNVADSDIPLFFWRQDDLVYYMVGNSFDHTRQAAQDLVLAAR